MKTDSTLFHIIQGTALFSFLFVVAASAQSPKLNNVDLCDGKGGTLPDLQIIGCTALIKSGSNSSQIKASAYNNRGDALVAINRSDLAMRDYNDSIKLNPNFAKAFNNRGVAF